MVYDINTAVGPRRLGALIAFQDTVPDKRTNDRFWEQSRVRNLRANTVIDHVREISGARFYAEACQIWNLKR